MNPPNDIFNIRDPYTLHRRDPAGHGYKAIHARCAMRMRSCVFLDALPGLASTSMKPTSYPACFTIDTTSPALLYRT